MLEMVGLLWEFTYKMCQLEQGQVKPIQKHESLGIHTPNTKNNAFLGGISLL